MTRPSPWWTDDRHADRRPFLLARNRIKSALRAYFEGQGFLEVEPGCLQVSPGNETHLHAFRTDLVANDLSRRPLYLHTSPEFACKKLLAAGEQRIFSFAPCFRNRERTPLHAPEFTMLEWYRAGEPYDVLLEDCTAIVRIAAEITGRSVWTWKDRSADVSLRPRRLSVAAAFAASARIALFGPRAGDGLIGTSQFAEAAASCGISCAADDTWSDIFSRVLTAKVEPHLGVDAPAFLDAYPVGEAALARPSPADPRVAERFEMYVAGVELANGFGELTDPALQRANLEAQMARKQEVYGERYPVDEDFLAALAHMPPASGCALGFDRLVMLATGAWTIDQVLWTPLPDFERER